jgi:hypothetical protein
MKTKVKKINMLWPKTKNFLRQIFYIDRKNDLET